MRIMPGILTVVLASVSLTSCTDMTYKADFDNNPRTEDLQVKRGNSIVNDPVIRVYFDNEDCPVDTAFSAKVKTVGGSEETVILAGSVPVTGGKKIKWKAFDLAGNPKDGVKYAVYFHPFVGDPIFGNPGTGETPFQTLQAPAKLPGSEIPNSVNTGGVDYKYTIARINADNTIFDGCKPLDPLIRIL
jgi:hypothetical protein